MIIQIVNLDGVVLATATTEPDKAVSSDDLLRMTNAVYKLRAQCLKLADLANPVFDGPQEPPTEKLNTEADE